MVKVLLSKTRLILGKKKVNSLTIYKREDGYTITSFVGNIRRQAKFKKMDYSGIPLHKTRTVNYYHAINSKGDYVNYYK